jgi:hypothetical protein
MSLLFSVSCRLVNSSPEYSPDRRFYTQFQGSICRDEAKTRYSLLLGEAGKQGREVLLELNASPAHVHYAWRSPDELDVQAPRASIVKEYGPFDSNPRVVITSP